MAVVKATIKSQLLALYNSAKSSPMTEDQFADTMADIIKDAILSAAVNAGIAVQVTPSTGTGATTATGSLT